MQTQDQPSIVNSRRKAVRWRKPTTQKAVSSLCVFGCLMFISLSERVGIEMRRSLREVCTLLWILSASEWSKWGSPPHRTPPPHTHTVQQRVESLVGYHCHQQSLAQRPTSCWCPHFSAPCACSFLFLGVWQSAFLVLKLSLGAPEKSYEISKLNLSHILFLSQYITWPSPWHLWNIKWRRQMCFFAFRNCEDRHL